MARNRFVVPDIVRLSLSDGDWIDVKRRLNIGEQRAMFAQIYLSKAADQPVQMEVSKVGVARVAAYVIGWSFTDAAGKPVAYSPQTIDALDPTSFVEVLEAVDAHIAREDEQRAAEKNATTGETS